MLQNFQEGASTAHAKRGWLAPGRTGHWFSGLILMAVAWSLPSQPARAQINPFGKTRNLLTAEDLRLGQAAARKLLEDNAAQPGTFESWANPKSGNGGTVAIEKVFEQKGMPCKTLRSRFHFKREHGERNYTLNVCRVESGQWKVV